MPRNPCTNRKQFSCLSPFRFSIHSRIQQSNQSRVVPPQTDLRRSLLLIFAQSHRAIPRSRRPTWVVVVVSVVRVSAESDPDMQTCAAPAQGSVILMDVLIGRVVNHVAASVAANNRVQRTSKSRAIGICHVKPFSAAFGVR